MKRSTAAFIIALLVHIIIILLFWILGMVAKNMQPEEKPAEHRIKVSLKEQPKTAKEAAVKNKVKQPQIAPPMPKGKQLKEIVQSPVRVPQQSTPVPRNKPVVQQPVKRQEPARAQPQREPVRPLPEKKKHIPVASPEKPAEESSRLYSMLSQKSTMPAAEPDAREPKERHSRISDNIKEAYGDAFGTLSEGEQKYLLDNEEIMRRITQEVLNRVGSVNIPHNLRVNSYNIIEFYLYPNGDISEIKFIKRSGFYVLDDTTKETIEYAYSRYPRPKQKTLIRYKVGYYLKGY